MENLWKIAFCLVLIALSSPRAQAQIGISGSFVNTSLRDNDGNATPGFSGFQGDLTYNFPFGRIVGLNMGAGYIYLRRKEESKVINSSAAECYSQEQHIRVPLHLTISIPIKNGFGFVIYGGGAVSYAISGVNAIKVNFPDGESLLTYDYYSGVEGRRNLTDAQYAMTLSSLTKSPAMRRFDAQAEAGLGIKLNSFVMVRGGYSYAFINRYKSEYQGFARRTQITAGLTLLF